jgi:hypothetical protein
VQIGHGDVQIGHTANGPSFTTPKGSTITKSIQHRFLEPALEDMLMSPHLVPCVVDMHKEAEGCYCSGGTFLFSSGVIPKKDGLGRELPRCWGRMFGTNFFIELLTISDSNPEAVVG